MKIIVLMSQKGGAGKSTLALHLAAEASSRGTKTLLFDMDPQGNLISWGKRRGNTAPDVDALHSSRLTDELVAARLQGYELVVIDTAPSADRSASLAAQAADLVLIPCRPAQFDLDAVIETLRFVTTLGKAANVVINAAPIRSHVTADAADLVTQLGALVAPTIIRQRVAFQHCLIDGRVASEFEPHCPAAVEIAALYDYTLSRWPADMPANRSAA